MTFNFIQLKTCLNELNSLKSCNRSLNIRATPGWKLSFRTFPRYDVPWQNSKLLFFTKISHLSTAYVCLGGELTDYGD